MRILLLLTALSMALALVFSAPAMAQDDLNCDDLSEAEEQAVFDANPSDPNNLDDDDDGLPCEDDMTDNGSFTLPEETTMMEGPTSVEPTTVEPTTVEPTTVEPTTVEPTAVEPTTATATATAGVLPETGGTPLAMALVSLALLAGGGAFAFSMMRS